MRKDLTIALAISLVLGAAAAWGSCAVPHRATRAHHQSGDANHVAIMSGGPNYALN